MLKISGPNTKTKKLLKWIHTNLGQSIRPSEFGSLSLLSGHTCPGARDCLSKAIEAANHTRVVQDGPGCLFRCFSASQEAMYTETYQARAHNTAAIQAAKSRANIRQLLLASIPESMRLFRCHIAGDFYSLAYLRAMVDVASERPGMHVYAYTKSLHHLSKLGPARSLPSNMRITLSLGSKFDDLYPVLRARGFATARVVFSRAEAHKLGLAIDDNDSLAAYGSGDFALLLHGGQPKGSDAGKALVQIRKGA